MNFPQKYKIWYLSMYEPLPVFAPNGKLMRSGHLARAFSRKKIKTLFMTTDFDHHTHKHIKLPDYIKSVDNYLSIYYIPSKGYKKDISIKRYLHNKDFAYKFLKFSQQQTYKPELIITQIPSLEMGQVVSEYCTKNKIPYVIDIRDLYPDNYKRLFPQKIKFLYKVFFRLQEIKKNKILNNASAITAVSKTFANWAANSLSENSPIKPKAFYIGYPPPSPINVSEKKSFLIKKSLPLDKKIIVFVGTFSNLINFDNIFKAFEELNLNKNSPWHLCIAGGGYKQNYISEKCSSLNNATFLGWLEPKDIHLLYKSSSLAITPYCSNDFMAMPNKFFECVAYELPILNSLQGEMSEFIKEYNLGFNFKNNNSESFLNVLKRYENNYDLNFKQKQNLVDLYKKKFLRDEIYDSFAEYIFDLIK